MIFDIVVSPTGQVLSDFRPLISKLIVQLNDFPILLIGPFVLFDLRVQVIVPPSIY